MTKNPSKLRSFKVIFTNTGKIAYVLIAPETTTAKELNETIFKRWNLAATEERSSLVNKTFVDGEDSIVS